MLQAFCEEGADVNFVREELMPTSILYALISAGRRHMKPSHKHLMKALKLLLKHGASTTRAFHGLPSAQMIQVLLDAGADIEEVQDGMTPLTLAASKKDVDAVKALLDAGANPNGVGTISALFAAIEPAKSHYPFAPTTCQILRILCDAGADATRLNRENDSILSLALTRHLVDYTKQRIQDTLPAVVQAACDGGADVNFHHHHVLFFWVQEGDTPLHLANDASTGPHSDMRAHCMRILISHGADVDSQNDAGQTPLHRAVISNELSCARTLLRHGAKLDIKDVHGRTALILAQDMDPSKGNWEEMSAFLAEQAELQESRRSSSV